MNPFDKQSIKRAAWRVAKNPPGRAGPGWLILSSVLILVALKVIFEK